MEKATGKEISPSWTFDTDQVENWAWMGNAFTPAECDRIIEYSKSLSMMNGMISNKDVDDETLKYRKSNICWIQAHPDIVWLYQRMTDIVQHMNNEFFGFELTGFLESFQFTEYKAPDGKYNFHMDKSLNTRIRKLSCVLQLTDPSEYEGGDFEIQIDETPTNLNKKEKGTLLVFPSWILHRVTPVTKGTRHSLVSWVAGPNFK